MQDPLAKIFGNATFGFAGFLLLLLVVTGAVWLLDKYVLRARRPAEAKQPWWVEYSISFFPVILIVFALRSFLVEPFKIPSGSMIPTLLIGDFILVNKYAYGVRLPVLNLKVADVDLPKRGDVMVFRFPADPSLDYIKRVVGLPGDRIEYRDKRLTINGKLVPVRPSEQDFLLRDKAQYLRLYLENFDGAEHTITIEKDAAAAPFASPEFERNRHFRNCEYSTYSIKCSVPPGHYFMMGDNRDNSSDSRVWGFVPEENIVGKAFFIWLNLGELGRFGTFR
jgi:signal peptidase I